MKIHLAAIFFGFVLGLCYPELKGLGRVLHFDGNAFRPGDVAEPRLRAWRRVTR